MLVGHTDHYCKINVSANVMHDYFIDFVSSDDDWKGDVLLNQIISVNVYSREHNESL